MPEKTSPLPRGAVTGFAIGVGLAISFGVGILIPGAVGIVSAVVGGIAGAITLRGARIASKAVEGVVGGALAGLLPGIAISLVIALLLDVLINQIGLLGWMVVFAATNIIFYDRTIVRWMVRVFPRQFPDEGQLEIRED